MCESYARSLLRVSVAQICQALGWDAVQLTACDLLSDVLHRYIQQLARGCHRYSELYGRTDPVLDDVGQAFRLLGVSLSELEDYVHNLEPVGFAQQTPLFPLSKNNVLQFPQPGVGLRGDAEERKDYVPDYMPPLVSLQEEEEEEEALADMGTSAEAMQVPLDDTDEDMDDDEAVNDENHPVKRHLDSPDAAMGMMPTSKRPRMHPGFSPDWSMEPREPLTSLNPQRVPPGMMASHSHDSLGSMSLSPETPGPPTSFRPQPVTPGRHSDHKSHGGQGRKGPKGSSPGRPRTKSPKGVNAGGAMSGSPICSPKSSKERKKSPGQTKSPKSPKSPKMGSGAKSGSHPQGKSEAQALGLQRLPLSALSERMGKENIHVQSLEDHELAGFISGKLVEPGTDNADINDSIDAVIARACAEREPDPFAFSSGCESESDGFSSPRRLTIMEPGGTPKLSLDANSLGKDTSTPLQLSTGGGPGNWTMDDSINEVIRKVNQGGPSAGQPQDESYLTSASASPPTPEPLLKMYQEKNKLVSSADIKKKLKKELKTKMKDKGEKPKDKERDKNRGKMKEKNKDKNRGKSKDSFSKEAKMPWKDIGNKDDLGEHFQGQRSGFGSPEGSMIKIKSRDGGDGSGKKEKDKQKDKKKEKSKKDKDKRDKGKDRQKISSLTPFSLGDMPVRFSPSTCLRIPSMLPPLPPILQDKDVKSKEKDKKKDKKKKKKKDKDKEREKERDKEEKKREKEKERIRLEKVRVETPVTVPSPVIPRLTLRVGAGQDKIVISKVVPNSEPPPKIPAPKTPTTKSGPGSRLQLPPPPPILPPIPSLAPPASHLPPDNPPPAMLSPASMLSSGKTFVRSVVTETVSTYVIRDEWGNQIWICPGCNKRDDGSPMIGCDDCDDWYHWPCVGMVSAPPEDQQWFCVKCAGKKKDKKHKKRKHKVH
ncbi:transcription initiation factor TFIID subunit 3-like isoform X1 [Coregonus clupeaformis]|uniref:transcription initiation factor TFIID subunit 3-like isoform X1 n=1 Tax=Coregonus clupeaformis TaxID=59861 RepID=UPI001E1C97C7|nr:transcription initiation factor TFIID subunit 3-like isoform X1 [Coregonus clupeaformis]